MDEQLHIVHHLYGEDTDPADLRRLLEDEALRQEYEALSEVKFYLDHRQGARPDPKVIDRIVAAAAMPQRGATPRQDRAARPGRAIRRFRTVGAVSAVLAVLLVIGIGLDQFQSFAPSSFQTEAVRQAPAAAGELEALSEEAPGIAGTGQPPSMRPEPNRAARLAPQPPPAPAKLEAAFLGDARDEAPVPSWDETDELLRVHRRMEMIRARSLDLIWDEAAVMSLDSLPTEPNAASGLEAASTIRRDNQ